MVTAMRLAAVFRLERLVVLWRKIEYNDTIERQNPLPIGRAPLPGFCHFTEKKGNEK